MKKKSIWINTTTQKQNFINGEAKTSVSTLKKAEKVANQLHNNKLSIKLKNN